MFDPLSLEIFSLLSEGVFVFDLEGVPIYMNASALALLNTFEKDKVLSLLQEQVRALIIGKKEKLITSLYLDEAQTRFFDCAGKKLSPTVIAFSLFEKSSEYKKLEIGKDFVANASHELRTPITIIKGFTETLQDIPNLSAEMFQHIIEKILKNCQRMELLIKNLLLLSDIEHFPKARFRECLLFPLIERGKDTLLSLHPEVSIKFSSDCKDIYLNADFDLLELAIANLLENAVKYSDPPAKIHVSVKGCDDQVKIAITDKGKGIPEKDVDYIFERFYTVDKTHSRKLGGAGLGLSLVKTIVEKHDGKIFVESILGKGSTFTLLLPALKQRVEQ